MFKSYTMRRILLVCFTLALSLNLFAQSSENNIEISFNEVSKIKSSTELPITQVWPRGTENNTMYAYIPPFYEGKVVFSVPKKYRKRYMAIISEDLKVIKHNEIILPKENYFQEVLLLNNSLKVFSRTSTTDMSNSVLSARILDKSTLELDAEPKELINIKTDVSDETNNIFFSFDVSPDSSKLLITYHQVNQEPSILFTGMAVFDAQLNKLWSDESVEPKIGVGVYLFNDFKVDNKGNVYSSVDVFNSKEDFEDARKLRYGLGRQLGFQSKYLKQSPNYSSNIICFTNGGKTINTYKLDFGNKKTRYVAFEPINNQLKCVGLYSDKSRTSILGADYFEIDPNKPDIQNIKSVEYGLDFILEGLEANDAASIKELYAANREFENGLYDLKIKFRGDGGFWFISEHMDISKEKASGGANGAIWLDCYQYKDISVLNFTAKGDLLWKNKINKFTFTTFEQGMYGSYGSHVSGDELLIFYNQIDRKRLALWDYKNAAFESCIFNKSGEAAIKKLSTVSEHEVIMQPSNIGHFSNKSIFFSGQETLLNRFAKVSIEK